MRRRFGRFMGGGLIGGSYNCRICGSRHSSAIAHNKDKTSLTQKIQMFIEELEDEMAEITFKATGREKIKNFFKVSKKILGIPDEPIYIGNKDIPNIGISLIKIKAILKDNLRILEGIVKEEAFMSLSETGDLEESFAKFKVRIADI